MITVYKEKEDLNPENLVLVNDVFFNRETAGKIDEKAAPIIEKIDGAKLDGKYKILSKFNNTQLDIDQLSSGCKTVLNVLYFNNKVFSIKECGENALEEIYALPEGKVYSDYPMIPMDAKVLVIAEGKNEKKYIDSYIELKEWWENGK